MNKPRGFTLLEVMVALAVLAIALGAIIQSVSANTNNISYLRDKTYAHWVASNRMAEMQTLLQRDQIRSGEGTEELGGHEWFWKVTVSEVRVPELDQMGVAIESLRRVDVEVRRTRDSKQVLSGLSAVIQLPRL